MSAQRASAPVRFARLAAAVLIVALAAVIIVRLSGRREGRPAPAPVKPPPEGRIVDLKEKVRQQEYRDGRPVVDIRGASFFRGPDGRNHLAGSVEIVNLGPEGETVSRLSADEVVYDPGSLRFTIAGHVRVEASGVVLEGGSFDYDKTKGRFETTGGGRFTSATIDGAAPEILYTESTDELRLGGGFLVEIFDPKRTEKALSVSGDSLIYARRERRGRVDGQADLRGGRGRGTSKAFSFVATRDESAFESAVFKGAAKVVFEGGPARGRGTGEVRAERIEVAFAREPFTLLSINAVETASLSLRPSPDEEDQVLAPEAGLKFGRDGEMLSWTTSGGIRGELTDASGLSRALEGESAEFDAATGLLLVHGGPGRAALADSLDARVEADLISAAPRMGTLEASGGVRCWLRPKEGGDRVPGFFSYQDVISVSSDSAVFLEKTSSVAFEGKVRVWQGAKSVQASKLELARETGLMRGSGGVAAVLTEVAPGEAPARTIEIGGQDVVYRPDMRTLTLSSKASVRLPEARLEAATVSAVIGRDGNAVESLAASTGVRVSRGRYVGRSDAASYQAATGRITLTGRPILTDDKGGSARGAKLTFDLPDDKILIENEGQGRATTVVRS